MSWKRAILAAATALIASCAPPEIADRILVGGNIITVDADDTVAEAVAIKNGKILAVGTNEEFEVETDQPGEEGSRETG